MRAMKARARAYCGNKEAVGVLDVERLSIMQLACMARAVPIRALRVENYRHTATKEFAGILHIAKERVNSKSTVSCYTAR